jgi:hypothetical protein
VRPFSESVVEDAALEWLEGLGWALRRGPEIARENLPLNVPITRKSCWSGGGATR